MQVQVDYWLRGSEMDWQSAQRLFASGQDLHWSVFLAHLPCEKALKALLVQRTLDYAPYTHNLLRLAEFAGLALSEAQVELLSAANQFNLRVRYPDEQFEFYKQCTLDFASRYLAQIRETRQWFLQQL